MNLRVTPLDCTYRGHRIGYITGRYGYLAAWRSSFDSGWKEGCIYVDSVAEIEQLAKECIDFRYLLEAREAEFGRRLTMDELLEFMKVQK